MLYHAVLENALRRTWMCKVHTTRRRCIPVHFDGGIGVLGSNFAQVLGYKGIGQTPSQSFIFETFKRHTSLYETLLIKYLHCRYFYKKKYLCSKWNLRFFDLPWLYYSKTQLKWVRMFKHSGLNLLLKQPIEGASYDTSTSNLSECPFTDPDFYLVSMQVPAWLMPHQTDKSR